MKRKTKRIVYMAIAALMALAISGSAFTAYGVSDNEIESGNDASSEETGYETSGQSRNNT